VSLVRHGRSAAGHRSTDGSGANTVDRRFRSPSAWFYSGCVWALCGVCAALAVVQEPPQIAVSVLLTSATGALLTWAVSLGPHLTVRAREVVVSNVLRTHTIPFGAVRSVRTRGLVEIVAIDPAARSGERTYRSWNAPGHQSRAPRPAEVYGQANSRHPDLTGAQRLTRSSDLPIGSGHVQQLVEERMISDAERDASPLMLVRTCWNGRLLVACLVAVIITTAAWWVR